MGVCVVHEGWEDLPALLSPRPGTAASTAPHRRPQAR